MAESELIWSEWDDSSLNKENWHGATPASSKNKGQSEKDVGSFIDPSGHGVIPPDFEVACWKRPQDIDPNLSYSVTPQIPNLEEFFSCNTHLLRSDLLQKIMLSYIYLDNAAQKSPFLTEYANTKFVPSFDGFWKPWYHIYSLCKAGKGQTHKPLWNPYGKYIIRFFLVGRWRRIVIDDFLPLDSEGRILLPQTKRREDLWLPLLTKALLIIAPSYHSGNFSVITCLTGWLEMTVDCANIDKNLVWKLFERHLKNDNKTIEVGEENAIEICIAEPPYCLHQESKMPTHHPYSPLILIHFSTLPPNNRDDCINYGAIIDFKDDNEGLLNEEEIVLEKWKIYRWKEWAIKNGILKDSVNNPGRKVLILTPNNLRKVQFLIPGIRVANETEKNEPAINLLLWATMDTLICCMRQLSIFYKPSEFKYSRHIDNFQEFLTNELNPTESVKSKEKSKPQKTSKKLDVKNTLSQVNIETNMNSFYLVCDTLYCKIFFISYKGFSKNRDISAGYSIIGETFSWQKQSIGTVLFSIHLHSPETVTKLLGPGLQIVRIWCNVPKHYVLKIFSYSEFTLCNREKVYQIMALPSIAIKLFAGTSSNLFTALRIKASDLNAHGEAYKKFIDSLEPKYFSKQVKNSKDRELIRLSIVEKFEELVVDMLLEKKPNEEFIRCLFEFQKLFLNPGFGKNYLMDKNEELYEQLLNEEDLRKQGKVTELPHYSSNLPSKEKQPKNTKKESNYHKDLDLMLDDPVNMMSIFRKFFEKNTDISNFYPYADCKEHEMSYLDYSGTLTLDDPDNIIFLFRFIINVDHAEKKPYIFQMFANCPIGLALFNNDTNEINSSVLSECANFQICHNEKGHSLLVFTSEGKAAKHILWKLRIIGSRDYPLPYTFSPIHGRVDSPPLAPIRRWFEGLYLPDKETNIFCKCVLKVQSSCAVTLALISSCLLAQMTLKIRGLDRKILCQHTNLHRVHLPFIFLNLSEGIESVDGDGWMFLIEGQVENNSWLLSEDNKTALKYFRDSELSKKLKKPAKKSSFLDFPVIDRMPTWTLRACFDQEVGNPQLLPDTQIADELRRQKENWVGGDGARRLEGLQCQQKFLEDYPEDYAHAWKYQQVQLEIDVSNGIDQRYSLKSLEGDVKDGIDQELHKVSKVMSKAVLTESLLDEYSRIGDEEPIACKEDVELLSTEDIIKMMDEAIVHKQSLSDRLEEYLRIRNNNAKEQSDELDVAIKKVLYPADIKGHTGTPDKPKSNKSKGKK